MAATKQARYIPLRAVLCLFLLSVVVSGCVRMTNGKPPGPWHAAYQPIDDVESQRFIKFALEQAEEQFGPPAIPVNSVILRRSRKVPEARGYRIAEDFSLTECVDTTNGVFAVYLAVDPDHPNYYPLLGHECAHLVEPRVLDWYMEGLATRFSEQVCEAAGHAWGDWERHFNRSRRDPYALSYRMMRELQKEFPEHYSSIIRYTADNGHGPDKRRIDIDAWLGSLPESRRAEARAIIEPYTKVLQRRSSEHYFFTIPQETL